MNKNILLFVVSCFLGMGVSSAQAQLLNVDGPETVSDSSNLIGKVTDYVKEAQKNIENSQFGKAIGDGVKFAKKGMAFAQEKHNEVMKYYNMGMKYKNELVNSPEFKISKKSTEIAKLEGKIKELEKQQKQAEQETDDKISLVQSEADAKIKNLNKNLANTKILMADGDNEQAQMMANDINKEIAQIKQNTADKISSLQNELQQKTGIAPQQSNIENDEVQDAVEKMDWEISAQNQDDVISSLKPGAKVEDTLPLNTEKQKLDTQIKELENPENTKILMVDGDDEQTQMIANDINNEIAQIKQNTVNEASSLRNELPQKTGVSRHRKVMGKKNIMKNAVEKMDWEISAQNRNDAIPSLKPGAKVADKLQLNTKKQKLTTITRTGE